MRDANERSAEAGRGPQGPRGLKWDVTQLEPLEALGRGPQGPRGLKFVQMNIPSSIGKKSRSARTARIEMPPWRRASWSSGCRGPQGPRGLKCSGNLAKLAKFVGRGPQGPRGLKLLRELGEAGEIWSRSARTARIEMPAASARVRHRRSVAVRKDRED